MAELEQLGLTQGPGWVNEGQLCGGSQRSAISRQKRNGHLVW